MCAVVALAGTEYAQWMPLSRPGLPRLPVSVAHSARPSPIHPPLASLQWKYQVIGC